MRILLTILVLFMMPMAIGQMQVDKTSHDFGNLYLNATSYVDFTFKNPGQSKTYLLTIDKPREVSYIYSSKTILPGEEMTLRLKINDNIKGRFKYVVDVYFGNDNKPVSLTLYGNIKEVNANNPLTACPDFNAAPPKNGLAHFDVTIKVLDSITKEPIRRSKVFLINNGTMVGAFYTNNQGIIHENVPLGLYYITAQKSGYSHCSFDGYLNYQSNYVEMLLQQDIAEVPPVNPPDEEINQTIVIVEEEEKPEPPEVIVIVEEEPEVIEEPEIVEVEKPVETAPVILDSNDFNSPLFVPNNIVFIVDVSASMNQMGKLDLLKESMIELTKILRPQDKVSLIAYSGSVNVLFEFVHGDQKDVIISKVQSLDAGGYTAGGEAIKQGIRLAKKGYIEGGNNLVFMVTDGAFNKGSRDYVRVIQTTYKTKDIRFSVVGVKTLDYLTNHMTTIATKGGGSYVRILTEEDAQNKLFEEVKRISLLND